MNGQASLDNFKEKPLFNLFIQNQIILFIQLVRFFPCIGPMALWALAL